MKYRLTMKRRCFLLAILNGFLCLALYGAEKPVSDTIMLIDAAGETVRLKQPAVRIVIVGRAPYIPLHMLYMFPEARQVLAGYERKVKSDEPFLSVIDSGYGEKTVLESNPGPEQIAALNPDLVITKETVSGPLARSMKVLGIPVMHLGVENPERFLNDIELIGRVLNNDQRAKEITGYFNAKLDFISKTLNGISLAERPKALTLEYSERGGSIAVKVPARSWIQTIQAQTAGGLPVWLDHAQVQDGWQVVGFEQIAAWNPDMIFMVVWYQLDGAKVIHSLKNDNKWKKLKAVSGNKLHRFPEDIFGWDTPDPRWVLGLLWLAGKMHPDLFKTMDMKTEVYEFFNSLYGLSKKSVDAHIIPKVVFNDPQ